MTVRIQIEDDTVEALRAQAEAQGLSLEQYVQVILRGAKASNSVSSESPMEAVVDFDEALDQLFASDTRKLPSVASTYSRQDIYGDHD